jgi:DNA-binding transcriptional MerR regulator
MSTAATRGAVPAPTRLLTIGTVCRRLKQEFADISISKIRYLEDQGLLAPRRTQGGYRLFSEDDVERLRTILLLQRDEFLPLRVIRQELASASVGDRKRKRAGGLLGPEDEDAVALAELCERAGITSDLARELEEFGLLAPRSEAGARLYTESDVEVASACGRLARYGIAPRHLRSFRTAAEREAGLLETVVAPAMRSRNAERRQAALEDLQTLAGLAQELSQLLFWRELRRQVTV